MPTVVGVKLRFTPKVLWFDPVETEPVLGDRVIVRTERGLETGEVVSEPAEVEASELPAELKPVERVCSEEDLQRVEELLQCETEALRVFRDLVKRHELDMKPIDVEFLFDSSKVVFYFVAEERVDFRELVKDLAAEFKTRIDMRQIGVRDEARMVGGLGHCGQQLCCVRFGGEFQPVSIRMAKEQDLPLNPLKISGLCGRLMCCLRYEYDAYKEFKSRAPKRGTEVETPMGPGKVSELNTPRETVSIRLREGGSIQVPLERMECGKGKGCPCRVPAEALEERQKPGGMLEPVAASALLGDKAGERKAEERAEPEKPQRKAEERAEPEKPQRKPRRRRRKREERPSEASGVESGAKPKAETKQESKGRDQGGSSGKAEGSGEDAGAKKQPKPRRRRRRRKPSGGDSSGGE